MKSNLTVILWRCCVVSATLLVILCFSPLILTPNKIEPFVLGMPYVLWSSLVISFLLVVLTFLVTKCYPGD